MTVFLLAFIPLFVAIDPIGNISLYIGLTQGFTKSEKRKLAIQAVITALVIGMIFGVAGLYIFKALGITPSDFQIAGGLLLLILSIKEMFGSTVKETPGFSHDQWLGVVPLGIPLTAGPAMITTLLILSEQHSYTLLMAALVLNLAIELALFLGADQIVSKFGLAFSKVVAKVVAIFLAAIGVMMIRRGVETLFLR